MVKVTSLVIKAGSGHGFSIGVRAWTKWRYGVFYKYMHMLKVVSSEQKLRGKLSIQSSSLCAILMSKTRIVAQKPSRRQLNSKVCSGKSASFLSLCSNHYVQQ